jgi:hypothetical protein
MYRHPDLANRSGRLAVFRRGSRDVLGPPTVTGRHNRQGGARRRDYIVRHRRRLRPREVGTRPQRGTDSCRRETRGRRGRHQVVAGRSYSAKHQENHRRSDQQPRSLSDRSVPDPHAVRQLFIDQSRGPRNGAASPGAGDRFRRCEQFLCTADGDRPRRTGEGGNAAGKQPGTDQSVASQDRNQWRVGDCATAGRHADCLRPIEKRSAHWKIPRRSRCSCKAVGHAPTARRHVREEPRSHRSTDQRLG